MKKLCLRAAATVAATCGLALAGLAVPGVAVADQPQLRCDDSVSSSCYGSLHVSYAENQPGPAKAYDQAKTKASVDDPAKSEVQPGQSATFTYHVTMPYTATKRAKFKLWVQTQWLAGDREVSPLIADKGTKKHPWSQPVLKELATCTPTGTVKKDGTPFYTTCDLPAGAHYFVAKRTGDWGGEAYGHFLLDSAKQPSGGADSTSAASVSVAPGDNFKVSKVQITPGEGADTATFTVTLTAPDENGASRAVTPVITANGHRVADVPPVTVTTPKATKPKPAPQQGLACRSNSGGTCDGSLHVAYAAKQPASRLVYKYRSTSVMSNSQVSAKPGETAKFDYQIEATATPMRRVTFDVWQAGPLAWGSDSLRPRITKEDTDLFGDPEIAELAKCDSPVVVPDNGTHVQVTCDVPEGATHFDAVQDGPYTRSYGHFALADIPSAQPAPQEGPDTKIGTEKDVTAGPLTWSNTQDLYTGKFVLTVPAPNEDGATRTTKPALTVAGTVVDPENVPEVSVTTPKKVAPAPAPAPGTGDKDKGNKDDKGDHDKDKAPVNPKPGNTDQDKTPGKTDQGKTPGKTDQGKTPVVNPGDKGDHDKGKTPGKTDQGKTPVVNPGDKGDHDKGKTPGKTDPGKTPVVNPGKTDQGKTPGKTDQGKTDQGKTPVVNPKPGHTDKGKTAPQKPALSPAPAAPAPNQPAKGTSPQRQAGTSVPAQGPAKTKTGAFAPAKKTPPSTPGAAPAAADKHAELARTGAQSWPLGLLAGLVLLGAGMMVAGRQRR